MNAYSRYLAAKKPIDDRSLNPHVWQAMQRTVQQRAAAGASTRVLEVGAGIGTMIERLDAHGLLRQATVTAVDQDADHIAEARRRLQAIGARTPLHLEAVDVDTFMQRETGRQTWDLLIAHAFLDLVDIPTTLPRLFRLLAADGRFYFTINFDGATILEPAIEPAFDAHIEQLYHRTMDERLVNGRAAGDSRSGRHLFQQLRRAGALIEAAGSSDWVVFAGADGYAADEATFLHFIVETMAGALSGHPALDAGKFAAWVTQRHAQIERGELVYIAHQLDFFGRLQPHHPLSK